MDDELPPIDIAVRGNPAEFVAKVALLADHGPFWVERRTHEWGSRRLDGANLHFLGKSPHDKLGVQLLAWSDEPDRVKVEVRAQRWNPHPPTYAEYVSAARQLVAPLLAEFNRESGARVRLRVKSRRQLAPRLSPKSAQLFERFAANANTGMLHHLDWIRFYEFVLGSRSKPLPEDQMARLLVQHGFTDEYAMHVAEIYGHLCEFGALR